MNETLPIACSLGADDLRRRLAEIESLGLDALISRDTDGDSQVLRFRSDPETRTRLERIVAAELECCAFLDLELGEDGDQIVLRITAPAEGVPAARELALAFGAAPQSSSATSSRTRRPISSRMTRTSSTGRPDGSARSQST